MNTAAYEPSFTADSAPHQERGPDVGHNFVAPPSPPRMSITPGEGGLGVMFGALAKAQLNFKPIKADTHVEVQTREKGSYKFNYAPLENVLAACVPALNEQGFFFSQPLYSAADGEGYVLKTMLVHASGGMIEVQTYIPRPEGRIQDLGSAITYQRRYVAQALFGVNSEEDDDGAKASGDKRTVQPPKAPPPSAGPPQRPASQTAPSQMQTNGKPEVKTVGGPAPAMPTNPPAPQETKSSHGHDRAEASGTIEQAPANETRVERPFTPEQDAELKGLFAEVKKLGAKISAPAITGYIQRLTGVEPAKMQEADAAAVIADLKARVAAKNIDFSPPRVAS